MSAELAEAVELLHYWIGSELSKRYWNKNCDRGDRTGWICVRRIIGTYVIGGVASDKIFIEILYF
jgi:hypothetical protein